MWRASSTPITSWPGASLWASPRAPPPPRSHPADITRAQLLSMVARTPVLQALPEPPAGYEPPFAKFDDVHYPNARKAAHYGLLDGLQDVGAGGDGAWLCGAATRGGVCDVAPSAVAPAQSGGRLLKGPQRSPTPRYA